MIEAVLLILVGAALIAAAVYDAATLTIPNWISLALIALFPLAAVASGIGWASAGIHVAVGVGALAVGVALFAAGVIGGGDAKLFAAVALYVGAAWFANFLIAMAFAGGALALGVAALRMVPKYGIALPPRLGHLVSGKAGIPYGVAIAAGGLFVLPTTQIFLSH